MLVLNQAPRTKIGISVNLFSKPRWTPICWPSNKLLKGTAHQRAASGKVTPKHGDKCALLVNITSSSRKRKQMRWWEFCTINYGSNFDSRFIISQSLKQADSWKCLQLCILWIRGVGTEFCYTALIQHNKMVSCPLKEKKKQLSWVSTQHFYPQVLILFWKKNHLHSFLLLIYLQHYYGQHVLFFYFLIKQK